MKQFIYSIFLVLLVTLYGCNEDNNVTNNAQGLGGLGSGIGNVSIQVQGQADGQGNYIFSINPSAAINLTSITASVASEQYEETIQINDQFQAGTFQGVLQYDANQIQTGLQFVFKFVGTLVDGGTNFDVTTNYTIP